MLSTMLLISYSCLRTNYTRKRSQVKGLYAALSDRVAQDT
jgi:hypothetical protein